MYRYRYSDCSHGFFTVFWNISKEASSLPFVDSSILKCGSI